MEARTLHRTFSTVRRGAFVTGYDGGLVEYGSWNIVEAPLCCRQRGLACAPCRVRGVPMKVILARPRGFRAGVERAIKCVEQALDRFGPPVYVLNDIVHNAYVVQDLRDKGAVFVKDLR